MREVAPLAGAWIEMMRKAYAVRLMASRPPRGGVD